MQEFKFYTGMKYLYLVRGLPGSGKTTLVKSLGVDRHYEADMYFMQGETYVFNPSRIKNAHTWCREMVEKSMKPGQFQASKIAISNTFTQEWEIEPYYELAKKYGYKIFSIICENRHEGVNVHGVPNEVLEKMKNRFEIKL